MEHKDKVAYKTISSHLRPICSFDFNLLFTNCCSDFVHSSNMSDRNAPSTSYGIAKELLEKIVTERNQLKDRKETYLRELQKMKRADKKYAYLEKEVKKEIRRSSR